MHPESFSVRVPDDVLEDLRARLHHTKWPEPLPYGAWSGGVDLAYLRELVDYWATSFDWRAQEQHLKVFHRFTTRVEAQLGVTSRTEAVLRGIKRGLLRPNLE